MNKFNFSGEGGGQGGQGGVRGGDEKKRGGTERADRYEGLYQISDLSDHKRLRKLHSK
jgi:hypothetical protein